MALPTTDEDTFLSLYEQHGRSATELAKALGVSLRNTQARLARIERDRGLAIRPHRVRANVTPSQRPQEISMPDGVIVVFSDAHYWPGEPSTAHRGLVKVCRLLGPDVVIENGDALDGASISRHPSIGWQQPVAFVDELAVCQERLQEIKRASPGALHLGSIGNHTARISNYLAHNAPAIRGMKGIDLPDLFPGWSYAWAWMVNGNTWISHKLRSGAHSAWNNLQTTHVSTVTGHTHQLQVKPRTTLSPVNNGTIYGVDTGTLADPWHEAFAYTASGPKDWRSGFAVLTFQNGILLPPEIAQVAQEAPTGQGLLWFRGQLIQV